MNIKNYISILLIFIVVVLSSCNNDDGPTEVQQAFEMLAGDWSLGTQGGIVLDGEDVSLNFPGFTLSFADGTYQTNNGGTLFRANGTWEWTGDTGRILTLDTGEEVNINALTLTDFQFSFFHVGNTSSGIQGNYVINVSK